MVGRKLTVCHTILALEKLLISIKNVAPNGVKIISIFTFLHYDKQVLPFDNLVLPFENREMTLSAPDYE